MTTSILERSRILHQDIEEYENKLVKLLSEIKKSKKDQVIQEYTAKKFLDCIIESERQLANIYEDKDKLRKEELDKITTQTVFTNFYDKLRVLKESHKTSVPPIQIVSNEDTDIGFITKKFSGEEDYGKNLDMHELHDIFLNLKFYKHRRCAYPKFLQSLSELTNLARKQKTFEYKKYIDDVVAYLEDFYSRVHPLYDKIKVLSPIINDAFTNDWEKGFVSGWKDKGEESEPEMSSKSDSKPQNSKKNKRKKRKESFNKELAFSEYKLCKYTEILDDEITNTIQFLEKKATRRWEEEMHDDEIDDDDDDKDIDSNDDEEDELIYNPKKLPKGWDDKPIPYWLYRLHGLNLEFKCEICGNYSYWGPKIFQKHFQEWRHSEGMKCLGIPNLKHFQNITLIEDALMLWEKIKKENTGKKFEPVLEEEFEDAEGNLITRAPVVPVSDTTGQTGVVTGHIPPAVG